ncbi:MAG: amidase, partial [Pseudonocardia sp.]|nr:amidase [Pseudonocardia sp.]
EGFGVDAVRAAAESQRGAGLVVEDVSVPWHLHGARIWDVISVEGAASQMVDLNGYGLNWKGLYDPEVMEHYGNQWRADGSQFSETVKLVLLAGKYALNSHHGKHYGMAQNLAVQLRTAYDEALARFDVLVLPTTPIPASVIPDPDAPREEIIGRALEMVANTCVTDVTGHPACSVPAGLVDGLPTGMMIVGKQFDDATVLRVAHTFEQAVGGFPAPASTPSVATAGSQA